MRRIGALVLISLLGLAMAAPVGAAETIQVRAFIKESFERAPSDVPCVFDPLAGTFTCFGRGNAGRAGPIQSVVVFDINTGAITRTITLRDGSTVVLAEEYTDDWTPGNSTSAPGAMVSFGNPLFVEGTFEVIGATGSLAGVTGSGTIFQVLAGNTIQIWFDGTLTFP